MQPPPPPWFRIPGPSDDTIAVVTPLPGSDFRVEMAIHRLGELLPVCAVCRSCARPVETGMRVRRSELPLRRSGQWRCPHCGGAATLPEQLVLIDRKSTERVEVVGPDRVEVQLSAITLAELLRLAQAARAVTAGGVGSEERLARVLAEAPEPIRRLRDRLNPGEWIALATFILGLVTYLTTVVKEDGGVSEDQLVTIIEQMIEQRGLGHDDLDGPLHEEEQAGGETEPAEESGAASSDVGDRQRAQQPADGDG